VLVATAWLPLPPARAQSNDEVQSATQWNFSVPGARSLALGGAFLAVADDATAAYANPAGLSQLGSPEATVEARAWSYTSRFVDHGHLPGTGVTGRGIDTVDRLVMAEREDDAAALSFASYVHTRPRLAFALYRHQVAKFGASLSSHGPFIGPREAPGRAAPARAELELDIAAWGGAAAWRPLPQLAVGATVSWQRFSLASRTERFARRERSGDPFEDSLTGGFYGPADFLPDNVQTVQTQRGDDHDLTGSLGVLWRPSARWSAGAVWRRGAEFGFAAELVGGPADERPGEVDPDVGGAGVFHVPDIVGVGVAWRPADNLVVAFDWDRVRYSALSADLLNLLRAARGEESLFRIDDADELHLGAEYQLVSWRVPLAVRLGAWLDPDHRLRYEGRSTLLRARFRPGEDELHLAAGMGIVVRRTQVDVAVDLSDLVDTLSLSAVTRF
jgi:long-subunit fatty acid transport protein